MTNVKYSDDELVAFLDGKLPAGLARAIEQAAGNDPKLAQRLSGLSLDTPALKSAFDGLLADAPELTRSVATREKPPGLRPLAQAAAIALAMFAGAYGYHAIRGPHENWQAYAAAYHALYVTETLSPVHNTPQQIATQLRRVSKALNTQLSADDLGYPGLEFKRAQILGFEDQPLVQLAFLSGGKIPVALCIRASDAKADDAMIATDYANVPGLAWHADGFDYLLLARMEPDQLQRMATEFQTRF